MAARKLSPAASKLLHDMLSLPTAPFAEHKVIAYIEAFCRKRPSVTMTRDPAGNILVHVRLGRRKVARPVCITAHLDHPGFVADRMIARRRLQAFWRGGVPKEYFVKSRVRFDVDGRWVKGTVESIDTVVRDGQERVSKAVLSVPVDIPKGSVGMWDFPDPVIRGRRIHARACDDLAGAAAMICAIEELCRTGADCDSYFLFTRAEEVGFVGAIAATQLKTIPAKCYVVAMETSSERPFAKMGDGPILRVGDKASTFTHAVTAHCHRIARDLALGDRTFKFQRKLMDGGTCESSAYCALGREATGLCIALGNYHNVDARKKKLGPEYVDLDDFVRVVQWFVELARAPRPYTGRDESLDDQLAKLEKRYEKLLYSTR